MHTIEHRTGDFTTLVKMHVLAENFIVHSGHQVTVIGQDLGPSCGDGAGLSECDRYRAYRV